SPAVPDRVAAGIAGVIRLRRLLRGADVRPAEVARRARERLRGREGVVRGRRRRRGPVEHDAPDGAGTGAAPAVDGDLVGRAGSDREAHAALRLLLVDDVVV